MNPKVIVCAPSSGPITSVNQCTLEIQIIEKESSEEGSGGAGT